MHHLTAFIFFFHIFWLLILSQQIDVKVLGGGASALVFKYDDKAVKLFCKDTVGRRWMLNEIRSMDSLRETWTQVYKSQSWSDPRQHLAIYERRLDWNLDHEFVEAVTELGRTNSEVSVCGLDRNLKHFVMKKYDCDLEDLTWNVTLDRKIKNKLFTDIIHLLKLFHGIGFAHRDIKMENILIDKTGGEYRPVLADFAFTKVANSRVDRVGTWPYLPLDVALMSRRERKRETDLRMMDHYALGITLAMLLSYRQARIARFCMSYIYIPPNDDFVKGQTDCSRDLVMLDNLFMLEAEVILGNTHSEVPSTWEECPDSGRNPWRDLLIGQYYHNKLYAEYFSELGFLGYFLSSHASTVQFNTIQEEESVADIRRF